MSFNYHLLSLENTALSCTKFLPALLLFQVQAFLWNQKKVSIHEKVMKLISVLVSLIGEPAGTLAVSNARQEDD